MQQKPGQEDPFQPGPGEPASLGIPSVEEVASRLAGLAPPPSCSAEEYGFLCALWGLYREFAREWTEVIQRDHLDRALGLGDKGPRPLLGREDVHFGARPILGLAERLRSLIRSRSRAAEGESDGGGEAPLEACAAEPEAAARAFFEASAEEESPRVLIGGCLLRPFLYMAAREAVGRFDPEGWRKGSCPVCGGGAFHAMIERRGRRRILVCGRCHFPWLFSRIGCPACGNVEQNLLAFYEDPESHPGVRVDVCGACHKALPVTIEPEEGPAPLILYDHLVALHLQERLERRGP